MFANNGDMQVCMDANVELAMIHGRDSGPLLRVLP
jgi:hypothetical protein